jgi:hypothetical protein
MGDIMSYDCMHTDALRDAYGGKWRYECPYGEHHLLYIDLESGRIAIWSLTTRKVVIWE